MDVIRLVNGREMHFTVRKEALIEQLELDIFLGGDYGRGDNIRPNEAVEVFPTYSNETCGGSGLQDREAGY